MRVHVGGCSFVLFRLPHLAVVAVVAFVVAYDFLPFVAFVGAYSFLPFVACASVRSQRLSCFTVSSGILCVQ